MRVSFHFIYILYLFTILILVCGPSLGLNCAYIHMKFEISHMKFAFECGTAHALLTITRVPFTIDVYCFMEMGNSNENVMLSLPEMCVRNQTE